MLSDRIKLTGTPFWGGGVLWDEPTDLSPWTVMAVAFKSSDPSFTDINITTLSGEEPAPAATTGSGVVSASAYGYVNVGEWHALRIPLADFGIDLVNVRAPFVIGAPGGIEDDVLLVDDVYLFQVCGG